MTINGIGQQPGYHLPDSTSSAETRADRVMEKQETNGGVQPSLDTPAQAGRANIPAADIARQDELLQNLSQQVHEEDNNQEISTISDLKTILANLQAAREARQGQGAGADGAFGTNGEHESGLIDLDERGNKTQGTASMETTVHPYDAYDQDNNFLKDLLLEKFEISGDEANTIISILENNSLNIKG